MSAPNSLIVCRTEGPWPGWIGRPPSALVEAVAQPDGDRVHRQQYDQQDTMAAAAGTLNSCWGREIPLKIWTGSAVNWLVSPSVEGDEGQRAQHVPPVRPSEARAS
jgi:hypothetical protein